jgi:hypothetical protein
MTAGSLALLVSLGACTSNSNGAPVRPPTTAALPSGVAPSSGAAPSGAAPSGAAPSGAAPSGAASSGVVPPSSSAPRPARRTVTLRVASGFGVVQVVAANVGTALVHAAPPAGVAAPPVVTRTAATVTITQPRTGPPIPVLAVQVTPRVAWRLDFEQGASVVNLDLHAAQLRGITVGAGVSSLTATLPAPSGTVPLTFAAGASRVVLRAVGAPPARVAASGGAGSVTLYGRSRTGVSGGTVLESPGWPAARDRFDISCAAGISTLTVIRG